VGDKLVAAHRQRSIDSGALLFTRAHRDFNDCEANILFMVEVIEKSDLPLNELSSWEKAFEKVKSQLAPRVKEAPPLAPRPEFWPYKFPEFHTYKELMRKFPGKMYTDFYNDRRGGELTQTAIDFRRLAQEVIDAENQRRQF
jgi:hypothetical protein